MNSARQLIENLLSGCLAFYLKWSQVALTHHVLLNASFTILPRKCQASQLDY